MQDPDPSFQPVAGTPEILSDGLRRILAPNPSPMTYKGTNTYILGERGLAVIDPGPNDAAHMAAILDAVRTGQKITHIFVTHAHLDHSPLARPLSDHTGAPVYAMGDAYAGRSEMMQALAETGLAGGGEGVDARFVPDECLPDLATVSGDGWALQTHYTPGHYGNHIALGWGDLAFTGDLVMSWASSLVSPPDGDLTDFMASCRRMKLGKWRSFHTGHGREVSTPNARLDWLINHRLGREAQIREALANGAADADMLAQRIYHDVNPALLPAAARNVFAHLIDLTVRNLARPVGPLSAKAVFEIAH